MTTHIHNDSEATQANEVNLNTVYPSPADLSIGKIIVKALLKNVPLFLFTLCLILVVSRLR